MTQIEIGQEQTRRKGYLTLSIDEMKDEFESNVVVHRAIDPGADEGTGIRYQKCGGGRRVIRKQRGGAY